MPNPTISIVTTVYDAKDYIPRTVRSILAQSFTDFELLLVEDGELMFAVKTAFEFL